MPGVSLSAAETYIFVYGWAIADQQGVRRVLHAGKLPKPVLEAGRRWEGRRIYTDGSVHFDAAQGRLHMWYNARVSSEMAPRFESPFLKHGDAVLHAASRHGIHRTRTNAGVHPFDGSKANKVVHHFHSPSVSNAVANKNQIRVYYIAITTTHGGNLPAKRFLASRASWRLDRFASLHAARGHVTTFPAARFHSQRLPGGFGRQSSATLALEGWRARSRAGKKPARLPRERAP